jgi:DNA ligase-1
MRLAQVVDVSERVSATPRKGEKVSLIAGLLREARRHEITVGAHYLSGQLPQGRLGIGWKTLEGAAAGLTATPHALSLQEVDGYFEAISQDSGAGSAERKARLLREILSRLFSLIFSIWTMRPCLMCPTASGWHD